MNLTQGAGTRRARGLHETRVRARVVTGAKRHAVGDPHGMTNVPKTQATDGVPTYLGRGDPAGRFADYYPAWVDKMAGDITLAVVQLADAADDGADGLGGLNGEAPSSIDPSTPTGRRSTSRPTTGRYFWEGSPAPLTPSISSPATLEPS